MNLIKQLFFIFYYKNNNNNNNFINRKEKRGVERVPLKYLFVFAFKLVS